MYKAHCQTKAKKHAGLQDKMKFSAQNKTWFSTDNYVFQIPHVS